MKRLKVAVIGSGFIASRKHLPALTRLRRQVQVVALCDLNQERSREVARQFGIEKVYDSLEKLLEQEQIDLVDICTPPQTHARIALQSLEGGAHVLIEKPMAATVEECDQIITASQRIKKQVCVVHSDLFYPSFLKARERVQRGDIGTFLGMRIFFSTPVDYITSKPDHWAHQLPGGVIGETGPHVVYLTLAFINPIKAVRVHAQKLLSDYPWSIFEDYRLDLIGETATSSVVLIYGTNQWAATVEIWGSSGILKADLENQCLVLYNRPRLSFKEVGLSTLSEAYQIFKSSLNTGFSAVIGRFSSTHERLIAQFCESIRAGDCPPVSAEEGREAVRVMGLIAQQLQR